MTPRLWIAIGLLAAGLAFTSAAWALTVTGRVEERSAEHVVVDGTRFMIDDQTRLFHSNKPDAEPSPYRPRHLEDVYRVRVSGINRKAQKIVILPFGYELGETR